MPTKDRQKLVTAILADVLGEQAQTTAAFSWLRNKQHETDFGHFEPSIRNIFFALGGDPAKHNQKRGRVLEYDAYFGGKYNLLFEFDEMQHFTTARGKTLALYPKAVPLGFDHKGYIALCQEHRRRADNYRRSKAAADFSLRREQRAFFDCFKDFLPPFHGLRPTLRLSEFDVATVTANDLHGRRLVGALLEARLTRL